MTLARALFFDVDIDEIMDNSAGWFNALLDSGGEQQRALSPDRPQLIFLPLVWPLKRSPLGT